jgi:hypothetical protein
MDMPINTFKQRLKSGKAQSWQPMPISIGY